MSETLERELINDEATANEAISYGLDSEFISANGTSVTLRDILTAVHQAQGERKGILGRMLGRKPVDIESVVSKLPNVDYIYAEPIGKFLGFLSVVHEKLKVLDAMGLIYIIERFDFEESMLTDPQGFTPYYGITQRGKAFVNYNEKDKSI